MKKGGWSSVLVSVSVLTCIVVTAEADSNVGCLFSESLCTENVEWCYDDNAFGKCLQIYGNIEEDDLYRFDLTTEELRAFEQELERLLLLGYRWSHVYTQCVLQGMLYALQNNVHYESTVCDHLVDQDLTAALGAFETDEQADPDSVAVVRYTPNNEQPSPSSRDDNDFADEVYAPPSPEHYQVLADSESDPVYNDYTNIFNKKRSVDLEHDPTGTDYRVFSRIYNTPGEFRNGHETKDLRRYSNAADYFPQEYVNAVPLAPDNLLNLFDRGGDRELEALLQLFDQNRYDDIRDWLDNLDSNAPYDADADADVDGYHLTEKFRQNYNTPAMFRQGYETRDADNDADNSDDVPTKRIYASSNDIISYGSDDLAIPDDFEPSEQIINNRWVDFRPPTAFTEGGPIYAGNSQISDKSDSREILESLLADSEWANYFRRKERLDVKKPGPLFDKHISQLNQGTFVPDKKDAKDNVVSGEKSALKSNHIGNPHVDDSYAYVAFKDSIHTWKEGEDILKTIVHLLNADPSIFTSIRVDPNELTFRVQDKSNNLNASEVASKINDIKEKLKKELGLEITSTGVGDKAKHPIVNGQKMSFVDDQWYNNSTILATCAASIAAFVGIASAILFLRYRKRRLHKLNQLPHDTEASEDYQQLCRARMHQDWNKGTPEKGQKDNTTNRIASLSKDSDNNSPSTRSSTSSWSEEPALTNMDISTGHMVLTYMEDHLKNKDRLEQEWRALCAYEAEPSAITAAEQQDNTKKNRLPGVLPYDHSRLVLSNVINQNNSDYINASTITDHDPRNPAYIASQGPLEHTAADFWQMVWEQGSVVMVMLTRLNENGVSMCHRYWPEEGADLYHIYEVHLVSEHIWCDDYLVRSFYLKNVKSGETRTVTQFHFLSWPDQSVPSSTKALLEFRRLRIGKVNKSYRGRSCPIVVHCSDGAGRTGTYCLIDMVLNRMAKGAKEIDIAATLEHIRDQRPHMVSSKQQFEFVLMAVAEEVHAILKALPAQLQQQHEKKEKEKEKELAAEKDKLEKEK